MNQRVSGPYCRSITKSTILIAGFLDICLEYLYNHLLKPISSLNASLTMTPHIFLYGFVLTLISLATSSPYRAAAAKSLLADSSNSDVVIPFHRDPDSTAFR